MLLNMMCNSCLISLKIFTHRTYRNLRLPQLSTPSSLISPIRLFQRSKYSHIRRLSPPPLIIKILILIPNIPLYSPTNHPPRSPLYTISPTFTIPTQPRTSATNNSLTLRSFALGDKFLYPTNPSIP